MSLNSQYTPQVYPNRDSLGDQTYVGQMLIAKHFLSAALSDTGGQYRSFYEFLASREPDNPNEMFRGKDILRCEVR